MMTREDLIAALKRLRRALHSRIVVQRQIVDRDGRIVRTIRHTTVLPKKKEREKRS
jgi:hypothetical protein